MAAFDRQGQPIPPEWFSKGVEPVREHLVNIARHILGDPWCVSELAEVTVHRLWEKHQIVVHPSPARLVLKTAMWVAEELKNGGSRQMRYQHLDLPLDALDLKIREKTLVDPTNYADLFEREILLDWVEDRLGIEGRTEIRTVYQLIRHGHTWQEIAEHLGAADLESVKRRFYRCIKKAANRHADLYQCGYQFSAIANVSRGHPKFSWHTASRIASANHLVHRGTSQFRTSANRLRSLSAGGTGPF